MPFVCIEPMVSHHDLQDSPMDIDEKSYLISLEPGKTKRYAFSVIVNHNGTF
jgi:galactose mutarotase-like enzyme